MFHVFVNELGMTSARAEKRLFWCERVRVIGNDLRACGEETITGIRSRYSVE